MPAASSESFSGLCAQLDCKLVHVRKSWSGYNEKIKRGVFTIWDDRLDKKKLRYEFGEAVSTDTRFGAKELRKNIEAIVNQGGEAFGIQCVAKDVNASPRARKTFDKDKVLNLRLTQERGRYVALVIGEVASTDIKAGFANRVGAYPDALNDLNFEPTGQESPNKTFGIYSGFSRDVKIRDAVLKRAKGKCEFCGDLGFLLNSGAHYVEAHHIIHLAKLGPDTMENVIALCPRHHREAHFGSASSDLEKAFDSKLKILRQKK